jgi:succinate dehydrogenase / fumarate reductase cytochrome b subunit
LKTQKRPVFNAVFKYRYPVTAIVSVLHRISGVILFLLIPLLLWSLHKSLASTDDFQSLKTILSHPLAIIVIWILFASLIYHLIAGIRHMLMDMGIAESYRGGRIGAFVVLCATVVVLLLIGVWYL